MLNVKNLSEEFQHKYKQVLVKRKDNVDAINFLKLLDTTNDCIFLTGKAGTWKSTLMRDIISFCNDTKTPALILWSTWMAALNIWWQTVHSFFSLWIDNTYFKDIQYHLKDKSSRKFKLRKEKVKLLSQVPFIVIDEISMLNANTLDCINFMMRYYLMDENQDNSIAHKPFGWKQIIFVWDIFQLPPVNTQEWKNKFKDIYQSERFFDSLTFKNLDYKILELQKSYRQENDKIFANILDSMRNWETTDHHLEILNNQTKKIDSESVLISTHRNKVDNINNERLKQLRWELYQFEAKTTWTFPDSMKKADDILRLKIWAKVMFLTNDKEWGRVNGSMGEIYNFWESDKDKYQDEDETINWKDYIKVMHNKRIVNVHKELWKNEEITISDSGEIKKNILWSYTQFPLKLWYAITVHKSQWLTFNSCQLDLCDTFTWWQVYTALSRSRTLDWIKLLNEISKYHIFFHPSIKNFIKEHLPSKLIKAIESSENEYELYDSIIKNKPIEKIKKAKPIEKIKKNKPIEKIKKAKPIEKIKKAKPLEKKKNIKPLEKKKNIKPLEKKKNIKPLEKKKNIKPLEKKKKAELSNINNSIIDNIYNRWNWNNKKDISNKWMDNIVKITIESNELWKMIEYQWHKLQLSEDSKIWDTYIIKWEWYKWKNWWKNWDLVYFIADIEYNYPSKWKDKTIELVIEQDEFWKTVEYKWHKLKLSEDSKIWDTYVIKWEWYKWKNWWENWDLIYVIKEIE